MGGRLLRFVAECLRGGEVFLFRRWERWVLRRGFSGFVCFFFFGVFVCAVGMWDLV